MSEPIWAPKHGTKTVELCRPPTRYGTSPFVVSVMPRRKKFVWVCHRDYFGLQGEGLADTIEQAKADALAYAKTAYEQLCRQIEEAVHPTSLVTFACKKLGVSEEALRAEYIVHREKDRREDQKKLLVLMMKDQPDIVLKMLETARDKGFIAQETIDQGKALGLFGPPTGDSST